MDVLADVFAATRVGGLIFMRAGLRPPWAMSFERTTKAGFHIVVSGSCWLRVATRRAPLRLEQGDVVLLPRGLVHTLSDTPDRAPMPYARTLAENARNPGEPSVELLCGAYHFDADLPQPLLALLPAVVHVRGSYPTGSPDIAAVVRLIDRETAAPSLGSTAISLRLVDALFLLVLRAWVESQPPGVAGWLGALRDAHVGRALAALHAQPRRAWTLVALARVVGTSRAVLARRFADLVGEPPLRYLARWRMTLAARALRDGDRSLAEIANDVGYESAFALSKAFKRIRGLAPAAYRRLGDAPERAQRVAK